MVTVEPRASKDKSGAYWACVYWKYGPPQKQEWESPVFRGRKSKDQ